MIKESIVLAVVAAGASGALYHYDSPGGGMRASRSAGATRIWIEQDGARVQPDGTTWRLRARPFTFVVEMPRERGVMINVSERRAAFDAIVDGLPLPEPAGSPGTGVAEDTENRERDLVDHYDWGSHYLFHERGHSRFDKGSVVLGKTRLRGRRTVERLRTFFGHDDPSNVVRDVQDLAGGTL